MVQANYLPYRSVSYRERLKPVKFSFTKFLIHVCKLHAHQEK